MITFTQIINLNFKTMKKFLLGLAFAAMAICIPTACSSSSDNNAQGADSTATDSVAQAPEEIPVKELKELENDHYLAKVPEGWRAGSRMVNSSCVIELPESPFTYAALNFQHETVDEFKAKCEKNGFKAIDDVTVGDKTWVAFYKEDKAEKEQQISAATPQADGIVTARLHNGANMMEFDEAGEALKANFKTIAENITLK